MAKKVDQTNLISNIKSLTLSGYVKKADRNIIVEDLIILKDKLLEQNNPEAKDNASTLNKVIKALDMDKMSKKEKDLWKNSKKSLIGIVNGYYESYKNTNNQDYDKNNSKKNNLNIDEVEKILDGKILSYNKFNENHPMNGVSYDKSKNLYIVNHDNVIKKFKTLQCATGYIINLGEELGKKNSKSFQKDTENENIIKKYFQYGGYYFLIYFISGIMYFDIQHIISVLNLKNSCVRKKREEFADNISKHIWFKNEHDGYIKRELVTEEIMYNIILSSNSTFSKSFKTEVSKILVQLRENGELDFVDDKIVLKDKSKRGLRSRYEVNKMVNEITDHGFDNLAEQQSIPFMYGNLSNVEVIRNMISMGNRIEVSTYHKDHVMYVFVIPIKQDHNHIIIKIGYSFDIVDRIKTLRNEYKSRVYLIRLKFVRGESDEDEFHKIIKQSYPHLIEEVNINNKSKTELYKFHPILIEQFDGYMNEFNNNKKIKKAPILTPEESVIVQEVKTQDSVFLQQLMEFKNNSDSVNKYIYDLIVLREKYDHELRVLEYKKNMVKMKYETHDQMKEYMNLKIKYLEVKNKYLNTIRSKNSDKPKYLCSDDLENSDLEDSDLENSDLENSEDLEKIVPNKIRMTKSAPPTSRKYTTVKSSSISRIPLRKSCSKIIEL